MQYTHLKDKSQNLALQALEVIETLNLPKLPGIFELWYIYFSEENPELCHEINKLKDKTDHDITLRECIDIYDRFLDHEFKTEKVQTAGQKISTSIEDVNSLISDIDIATTNFSDTLEGLNKELNSDNQDQEALKKIVSTAVQETNLVLEKNKYLTLQLRQQARLMEELKRDINIVCHEAMTDGLTNIANRKAFDAEITKIIASSQKENAEPFSIIFMDIDHFKAFNDNYGHQVGDQVLRLVAKTLLHGIKGKDFVARYGGEEFAIILPETNQNDAIRVANSLRSEIAKKQVINRSTNTKLGRITMSGGVTEYFYGDTQHDLLHRADTALYEAKESGRNQICLAKVKLKRD